MFWCTNFWGIDFCSGIHIIVDSQKIPRLCTLLNVKPSKKLKKTTIHSSTGVFYLLLVVTFSLGKRVYQWHKRLNCSSKYVNYGWWISSLWCRLVYFFKDSNHGTKVFLIAEFATKAEFATINRISSEKYFKNYVKIQYFFLNKRKKN